MCDTVSCNKMQLVCILNVSLKVLIYISIYRCNVPLYLSNKIRRMYAHTTIVTDPRITVVRITAFLIPAKVYKRKENEILQKFIHITTEFLKEDALPDSDNANRMYRSATPLEYFCKSIKSCSQIIHPVPEPYA